MESEPTIEVEVSSVTRYAWECPKCKNYNDYESNEPRKGSVVVCSECGARAKVKTVTG